MPRARRSTSTGSWRSASAPARPPSGPHVTALIAAAGSGERLGAGGPKALVDVGGRPLVRWSLDACAAASSVVAAVIAAPPGREAELEAIVPERLEAAVIAGGATRAESVALGLELVGTEYVAVHDAARPLLTAELADHVASRLAADREAAGAIVAAPITDTVKRVGADGAILRTERRDELWAAQTPQVFRTEALRRAHAVDAAARDAATDDAMLVEQAGGRVLIVEAPGPNLKVTTARDLRLAELLLSA